MILTAANYAFLAIAATPLIYYALAIYSSLRFFSQGSSSNDSSSRKSESGFAPPVSNLKPIRGLDPDAYENLASFCRQDYPEYEVLFCVDLDDPALPVIEKLKRDFPERNIRVLFGSGRVATNDKVAKLARLVSEASHDVVVISDSDVRVPPDYLRTVVAPLAQPKVGAVTCFYVPTQEAGHKSTFVQNLQSTGMLADFYAGILVAWQVDGVKFALGPTIATTRDRLAGFGGYQAIENKPADDLLVGRLIADQGYDVELLPYCISTVADYHSFSDLFYKRLRWITVMRHMRPWGHLGLLFTHGLPWSIAAALVLPWWPIGAAYLATYYLLRSAIVWSIGVRGLRQRVSWKELALIPVWDGLAFAIWLISFGRKSVRWRNNDYYIRDGMLVPVTPAAAPEEARAGFD